MREQPARLDLEQAARCLPPTSSSSELLLLSPPPCYVPVRRESPWPRERGKMKDSKSQQEIPHFPAASASQGRAWRMNWMSHQYHKLVWTMTQGAWSPLCRSGEALRCSGNRDMCKDDENHLLNCAAGLSYGAVFSPVILLSSNVSADGVN